MVVKKGSRSSVPYSQQPAFASILNQGKSSPNPHIIYFNVYINPYPTVFPYGNGMVLHFYQQQESSTTKTVHKVINKGLKTYV